jgi:uncharacterized OB-fold protein
MTMKEAGLMAGLPHPTTESKPFWEGCNAEQLLLQRCGGCSHVFYYARRLCPACGSTELAWEESSGHGVIYSFSEVHVPFQGPEWGSQVPYTIVLVDLDEGPRMLSRWLGDGRGPPLIGQHVKVTFPEVDGQRIPFFGPNAEGSE